MRIQVGVVGEELNLSTSQFSCSSRKVHTLLRRWVKFSTIFMELANALFCVEELANAIALFCS